MGFESAEVTRNSFLGETVFALQPKKGFRAGIDSVLLAASVPAKAGQSVLELGCGAGIVSLCLARRVDGLTLAGLELQADYAELARRNARLNAVEIEVEDGDVAEPPRSIRARQFDHVIANPPYYRIGAGSVSSDEGRERSLRETSPLEDWISCAVKRLKPGGCFTMINRAERLEEILGAFKGRRCSLELKPVYSRSNSPCIRVLFRARKDRNDELSIASPLILFANKSASGDSSSCSYSACVERLLRNPLPLRF